MYLWGTWLSARSLAGLDDSSITFSFDPVGNIQRLLAQQHGTL